MRNLLYLALGTALAVSLPGTAAAGGDKILEFDTMAGVNGGFLRGGTPVRDVEGGGLPWVLDEAKGELDVDGELEVEVEGLIIPAEDGFGFNPAPFFRAAVSCLTQDATGLVSRATVFTDNGAEVMIGDPENGDAKIEAELELPSPCVAPIVFVTSPGGAWFSVTGAD